MTALFSLSEITASPALDYVGIGFDENYNCYLPPVNRHALAKLPHQNAQHGGILHSRANMVSATYEGGKALSKMEMRALCLNLIQFGDVGLLKVRNGFGQVVRLVPLSSLYLRVRKDGGYSYLMKNRFMIPHKKSIAMMRKILSSLNFTTLCNKFTDRPIM